MRDGDLPVEASRWRRLREKVWFRWTFDLLLILIILFAVSLWQARHLLEGGEALPPMELISLDGETLRLDELDSRRTVVYLWATWCGACGLQKGAINSLHRRSGDNLQVISVVFDSGDRETVRAFVEREGIEFPVYMGTPQLSHALVVRSFPTTYIVDEDSRIRSGLVGYKTELGLRARLLLP